MRGIFLMFLSMMLTADAILCPAGEFSFDETCDPCPLGTDSPAASDSIVDCTCRLGHMARADGLRCDPCEEGFFKNITGFGGCFPCPIGSTSQLASTTASQCQCKTGYGGLTSSACSACALGTHKNNIGNTLCTPCSESFTTEFSASTSSDNCTCPENALIVNDVCTCKSGAFYDRFQVCHLCPVGFYKSSPGNWACNPCETLYSTVGVGSLDVSECKCQAGLFKNENNLCEQCPVKTFNKKVGANGIEECLNCSYRFFQPSAGQSTCFPLFVNLGVPVNQIGRVVGLFVENQMSCAYISQTFMLTDENTVDERTLTHKKCWGALPSNHEDSQILSMLPITQRCGDGIFNPATEQCDDGNTDGGDGCADNCLIEPGFFCEARTITADISHSLLHPSVCCRINNTPAQNSPSCRRCGNRPAPFAGTRFRSRNCELIDVNECEEAMDECTALSDGRICVNHDAIENNGTKLFSCECPTGLYFLGGECILERFAMKFTLLHEVSEINFRYHDMKLMIIAEAKRAIDIDYPIEMIDIVVHDVTGGVNQRITCKIFADSWLEMQRLTSSFDTVRFLSSV